MNKANWLGVSLVALAAFFEVFENGFGGFEVGFFLGGEEVGGGGDLGVSNVPD